MTARAVRPEPVARTESLPDAVLLDAALEAFAAKGFDAMSVRELARDLGVSHNFLPQRFGSKLRLWHAAVDHGFGRVVVDLLEAPPDPDADEAERLRAAMVRFVEAMGRRPALLRIIVREAGTPGPRLDHLVDTYIDPVRRGGDDLLAHLAAEGRVRTRSAGLLYFLMIHGAGGAFALPGLAGRFGEAIDPDDHEAVHRHAVEAVDVIVHGLLR